MSEISAVSSAAHAVTMQAASMKLLATALKVQTEAMADILASMGLGQNIDIEA